MSREQPPEPRPPVSVLHAGRTTHAAERGGSARRARRRGGQYPGARFHPGTRSRAGASHAVRFSGSLQPLFRFQAGRNMPERTCSRGRGNADRIEARPLRDHRQARRGRHGRGLSRHRHQARAARWRSRCCRAAFTADPERLARFEREAKLLAQLHHPNIASIFGLEESDGVRALVMELVDGPDARRAPGARAASRRREPRRSPARSREALEEAHEKGIVHRDLKPANIKLTAERKGEGPRLRPGQGDGSGGRGRSAADLARSPTIMNSPTMTAAPARSSASSSAPPPTWRPSRRAGARRPARRHLGVRRRALRDAHRASGSSRARPSPTRSPRVMRQEIDWAACPPARRARSGAPVERCLERRPEEPRCATSARRGSCSTACSPARAASARRARRSPPLRAAARSLAWSLVALLALALRRRGRLPGGREAPATSPVAPA